jgi:hypothetical protein
MVTVVFNPRDTSASKYSALSQYDYGQVLRIQGLNLPAAVKIDFALQPKGGTSVPRIGITKDGVTDVIIPDSMLENNDSTDDYNIYAFVFLTDATSGQTEYRITLGVKARPKPEVPGGTDNPDIFHEAVQAVREAAEQAAESEKQAEGWAHGREDLPERAEDNARYYAGQAQEDSRKTAEDRKEVERLVESVSGIDEQVAKVEELSKNAQEATTRAETSAEQGEIHKQAAQNASTAAQAAAGKTAEDRAVVQKTKEAVEELSTQVQENKDSVDKTAKEFTLSAQQTLADVNNAGQTQTDRVQTAGETAVRDIQTAQRTATGAVETAKTEAVKTVQTEGATQTGKVTAEGEKQVQAVQAAAQEIIADRGQIQTNKTDIADLRQSKAGAIVETTKGSMIQVVGSAEAFMEGLKLFGKSEQITTTGAQLFDESQIEQNDSRGFKFLNLAVGEGNFTLSSDIPKSPTDQSAYIMLISGNVKASTSEIASNSNGVYSGQSRTFPSKDGYMTIAYRNDSNTNNLVTFNKYWYMLNAGDTAKPFEPYTGGKPSPSPDYPQEIKNNAENGEINANVITGNLFPLNKFKGYEVNNSAKQITLNGDRILFTGKGTTGKEDMVFFLNKEADKLSLPPGKYTLSFKSDKPYGGTNGENTVEMYLIVEKKSGTVYQSTGNAGKRTVDIEDGDKMYFRFDINNNSMSAEFYDIMFNLGDTPLPYEPHDEQSLAIQTPNGLPGIPVSSGGNYTDSAGQQWVCDEIDLERGKYVQRIGVETKSGGWTLKETPDIPGRYLQHNITANKYKSNNDISLCNIALYSSWGQPQPKKFAFVLIDKRIYIAPPKDMQITADELNAILNNLDYPVVVAGQLNTPIETDLPPETIAAYKVLHTYYPTTVVTNNANADMQLDYVADTKLYIKKELEKIVSTQIQKTANLLSLMPLSTQAAMIENDTNNILDNMEVEK